MIHKNTNDKTYEPETEIIIAAGGKILSETDCRTFLEFWNAFDHQTISVRAAAAKVWLELQDEKNEAFMQRIIAAATHEAETRGTIARHAPRWLTERCWELYETQMRNPKQAPAKAQFTPPPKPEDWTAETWKKELGPVNSKNRFKRTFLEENWPHYYPGKNPWTGKNLQIPQEIYDIYAYIWSWK